MHPSFLHTLAIACAAVAAPAFAQVTFYEHPDFGGRAFSTDREVDNLAREGFNDRASSVVVQRDRWLICEKSDFGGRCVTLRPGRYASITAMGLDDRVSSVRPADDGRASPPSPSPTGDFRRRRDERLFEANVTSVRAVMGPPEQRCWVESEQAPRERVNPGGVILGAVIGGILGHQVGGGSGKQLATVGGVVAGAAVGSQVGRGGGSADVQRCETRPAEGRPSYWDVTYIFRGQEHRVQLAEPPGPTVTVNRRGEPRA